MEVKYKNNAKGEFVSDKQFNKWRDVKAKLHYLSKGPMINEGEVYWCAFGENIGAEINGKNRAFSRLVLVLKKLSAITFLGVPLTSKLHTGTWYVDFRFLGNDEVAVLSQIRVLSVNRLYDKMGEVDKVDLSKIREGFHRLYCE